MKLKNQEIIKIINALQTLENKELPIILTYKVIDNFDSLMRAYGSYEKALDKAKTEEEIQELLQIEKDVDVVKFNKQELIDAGVNLSPVQLVGLKELIDG